MRQRKLGSHTPPCHRRMVITTLFSDRAGGGGVLYPQLNLVSICVCTYLRQCSVLPMF